MLLLFALCTLVPGAFFGYVSLRQIGEKFEQETARRMRLQSRDIAMAIHGAFSSVENQVEFLAGVVREGALDGFRPSDPKLATVSGAPLLGATLLRTGVPAKVLFGSPCPAPPITDAVRSHLASGQALLYLHREPEGKNRLLLAHAVRENAVDRELLLCELNPVHLWERVQNAIPPISEVSVLAPDGEPLFETRTMPDTLRERVERGRKLAAAGHFEWGTGSDALLVDHVAVFLKPAFAAADWTVVLSQPRSEAYAVANRFTRVLLLSILLVLLVVGLLANVLIRRNLAPLAVLKEGTRRISEGDFDSRVRIGSGDEFEELARSFNSMADRLGREFRLQAEMGRIVQAILAETTRDRIARVLLDNVDAVVPCDGAALILCDAAGTGSGATAYLRENRSKNTVERPGAFRPLSAEEALRIASVDSSVLASPLGTFGDFRRPWTGPRPSALLLSPILSGGELMGVLLLGYREPPDASPETRIRLRQVADQAAIALNRSRLLDELTENELGTLQALARAVDTNSPWTAGHSQCVTEVAVDIGRELGLPPPDLDLLRRGGLLHDIGKLGIPASVLNKDERLTDAETALLHEHPAAGARILGPIPNLRKVIPLVAQHHERFDGKGYPKGLSGDAISLHARIIAVADVFEALSADRPYRAGWPRAAVVAHIRENAGLRFDPAVVAAFLRLETTDGGPGLTVAALREPESAIFRV